MGIALRLVTAFVLMFAVAVCFGAEGDSPFRGDVEISHYASKDKGGKSKSGVSAYVEYSLTDSFAPYATVYGDQVFTQGLVGMSSYIGDFQVGLGLGSSRFDGTSHVTLASWLYYEQSEWQAYVEGENYYLHSKREGSWGRGYIQRTSESGLILGVAAERGVGRGPLIGYQVGENFTLTLFLPTGSLPQASDRVRAVVSAKVTF
jgi:hypothetical protein